MAAADAVLPSPPPPARIVVVVLALARFALAPMLALGRVLCVAAGALPYLWFAAAWVISAASAAQVVALRAWGEGSAPFLFLQVFTSGAYKVCAYSFLVLLALAALLLCGLCVAYVIAVLSGSGSSFNKRAGAIAWESAANHSFRLPRAAVLGLITDVSFFLLLVAGLLLAMMSHVEGSISQGEMVGLVIADVGIFGMHAISCILIIPALALSVWREDQADRTAPSQSC
ncbi:uncharacterized protein LOC119359008 [Triticum dicoccoides]|uniref:uncharacterized protein LOC119359008 n=1 Tax=Triticum dicoccoides TaxID=85692 RepID=UPI00162EF975|nr:uncharacterized protein LOC119359008 [Triticum dicoccoides]XP_037481267.1 uncharacterized protein LOC119359008 [Triticum dicoccoides]